MISDHADEQRALKAQLRRILDTECPRTVVRAVLEGKAGYDPGLWTKLAEAGWLGASLPEEKGGLGLGEQAAGLLAEELGRALAPVPLTSSIFLAAEALARHGSSERQTQLLASLIAGETIATPALSEGQGPLSKSSIAAKVEGGRLSGAKYPVPDGLIADVALVAARDADDDVRLFIVDLNAAGVTREALHVIDPAKPQASIRFEQAPAEPVQGADWPALERLIDRAAILTAFEQVGASDVALEMARDYALFREAYGRPIGSYQAIKHKLARVYVEIVMARSAAEAALDALASGSQDLSLAASVARLRGNQAFDLAAREMVQTHGGIAVSWEHDAQLFYRRARHLALVLGSSDHWRSRLADRLVPRVLSGDASVLENRMEDGEAEFRAEARAWLAANAPAFEVSEDSDPMSPENLSLAKAWQRKKYDSGYVGLGLPESLGGRNSPAKLAIFREEEGRYRLSVGATLLNDGVIIPVFQAGGYQEFLDRFTPAALTGEELWCEMFSEPSAGSDVASITTRAERDGDAWVINGGKVWTSFATWCDWAFLLTRTNPELPKHRGLTMFLLDLRTPGVDVRPLRTMHGDTEFTQTFLTDVRIPDSMRLGEVGEGWALFNQTLLTERLSVLSHPSVNRNVLGELVRISASAQGHDGGLLIDDPGVRRQIADYYALLASVGRFQAGMLDQLCRGELPGPEASIGKLVMAKPLQDMASWGMDLLGQAGAVIDDANPDMTALNKAFFWGATYRIAGGADEIMLNLISEHILGLPREPNSDRNMPFNQRRGSTGAGAPRAQALPAA